MSPPYAFLTTVLLALCIYGMYRYDRAERGRVCKVWSLLDDGTFIATTRLGTSIRISPDRLSSISLLEFTGEGPEFGGARVILSESSDRKVFVDFLDRDKTGAFLDRMSNLHPRASVHR